MRNSFDSRYEQSLRYSSNDNRIAQLVFGVDGMFDISEDFPSV